MLKRILAHVRSGEIDYPLLIPLLASAFLAQTATTMIRVTISYRAVELDLSLIGLGFIAATFALCPALIAVRVGRIIDRGYDAQMIWTGTAIYAAAAVGFVFWSSPAGLLALSGVMGIGHIMMMASQQMLTLRAASPRRLESVFGNFMVTNAIGQGLGPYVVGWFGGGAALPPTQTLFVAGAMVAAAALIATVPIRPARTPAAPTEKAEPVPVSQILRIPGLVAVIVAGVMLISASDVIVVYIPLLGAERHIDVHDIGLLLTVRAAFSMLARLLYVRMVAMFGRWPMLIAATFFCGASHAAIAAPIPLWAMYAAIAVMGFSFGAAITLSITTVVDMTTVSARGTTNSLRIMGNRIGQFTMPFGAGLIAAVAGVAGLFLALAGAIMVSAAAVYWRRPKPPSAP